MIFHTWCIETAFIQNALTNVL